MVDAPGQGSGKASEPVRSGGQSEASTPDPASTPAPQVRAPEWAVSAAPIDATAPMAALPPAAMGAQEPAQAGYEDQAVADPDRRSPSVADPGEVIAQQGPDRVGDIPAVRQRRTWVAGQFANWRLYLVRMVSAGLSVLLAVIIVPGLSFASWSWGQGLEISVIFALINAFVKPVLQFLSLRFLFSSYGIIVVLINTVLLVLLSWSLSESIVASGIVPVLLGGALIGVLGAALDAALGADYPVLDRAYRGQGNQT